MHLIDKKLIETMMTQRFQTEIEILNLVHYEVDNSSSILTTLNESLQNLSVGHYGIEVTYLLKGIRHSQKMILKVKTHGSKTSEMLSSLAQLSSPELGQVYSSYSSYMGFENSHLKELLIYDNVDHGILPEIFGIFKSEEDSSFMILMEDLTGNANLNSVMRPEIWTMEQLKSSMGDLASWHNSALQMMEKFDLDYWENDKPNLNYYDRIGPVLVQLLNNIEKSDLITSEQYNQLNTDLESLPDYAAFLEEQQKTIIHNDCNLRNACLKNDSLILYDWELVTIQVPHYDLAEFICFAVDPEKSNAIEIMVKTYYQRQAALEQSYQGFDRFIKTLKAAAAIFALHRLGLYAMAHKVTPYPYLKRVYQTYFSLKHYCESVLA